MAFPTGSGSERIKYSTISNQSATVGTLITGVALHIYTIVSIIVCECGDASDTFDFYLTDSNGTSNPHYIAVSQPINGYETFVFNDRFAFDGNKMLRTITSAGANLDMTCTYIDQNWID
jgi:hypothetical protein